MLHDAILTPGFITQPVQKALLATFLRQHRSYCRLLVDDKYFSSIAAKLFSIQAYHADDKSPHFQIGHVVPHGRVTIIIRDAFADSHSLCCAANAASLLRRYRCSIRSRRRADAGDTASTSCYFCAKQWPPSCHFLLFSKFDIATFTCRR